MILRKRRRYWELKDSAENRKRWKQQLISGTYSRKTNYFQKSMDLLISNNRNNNNKQNYSN